MLTFKNTKEMRQENKLEEYGFLTEILEPIKRNLKYKSEKGSNDRAKAFRQGSKIFNSTKRAKIWRKSC